MIRLFLSLMVFAPVVFLAVGLSPAAGEDASLREQRYSVLLEHLEGRRSALPHDSTPERRTCGLWVMFEVAALWPELSAHQKSTIIALLEQPTMQVDTVIGYFRIHYDTSGNHEPALLNAAGQRIPGTARAYVDSVGRYFNEVWSYTVDTLGYLPPPLEVGESHYNIVISNIGEYGFTKFDMSQPITPGPPPRFATYITIHNDYRNFFSRGMDGLKVTAAHEFHHAVQLGSYGLWHQDIYFYEITSTWMEDVMYTDVNDYYQYIRTPAGAPRGHFADPELSLTIRNGLVEYSRAIFGKFIEKRFTRDLIRSVWERMASVASIPALDFVLGQVGLPLQEALVEFSLWNYFTASRADTINYYSEGHNYPEVRLRDASWELVGTSSTFTGVHGVQGLGTGYYGWRHVAGLDTVFVVAMISNVNIAAAGSGVLHQFQYTVRSVSPPDDTFQALLIGGRQYWVKVDGPGGPQSWKAVHSTGRVVSSIILAYPNPFLVPDHGRIRFQIPHTPPAIAQMYIYGASMELIYSGEHPVEVSSVSSPFVEWNGRRSDSRHAASGVYLYVISIEGQQYLGKFTLIKK